MLQNCANVLNLKTQQACNACAKVEKFTNICFWRFFACLWEHALTLNISVWCKHLFVLFSNSTNLKSNCSSLSNPGPSMVRQHLLKAADNGFVKDNLHLKDSPTRIWLSRIWKGSKNIFGSLRSYNVHVMLYKSKWYDVYSEQRLMGPYI